MFSTLKLLICSLIFLSFTTFAGKRHLVEVIAHRGASGYLPEHTREAVVMAHAQRADYIEQDVVLSKDGVPIVLHDIHIDTTTDVATKFPKRRRKDGRFYAIDFTLAEIKTLEVHERVNLKKSKVVFPNRFPFSPMGGFRVQTLEEEINLIHGLNKSTGHEAGLFPEIKSPSWHLQEGQDITKIVLGVLEKLGYPKDRPKIYVQCFESASLKRIRKDFSKSWRLIQLIGSDKWNISPENFGSMLTNSGLKKISRYSYGIGPWTGHIFLGTTAKKEPKFSKLVSLAHGLGLKVMPFTFRSDHLPGEVENPTEFLDFLISRQKVDGLFSDFPDFVVSYLKNRRM